MIARFLSRLLIPVWTDVHSYEKLILASFCYPASIKGTGPKIINGILFYFSISLFLLCNVSHGLFFNFHAASWPTLAKILSYHRNLSPTMKIIKYMAVFASGELMIFRFYFLFLRLKGRDQMEKLLKFSSNFEPNISCKVFKLTRLMCYNISVMGMGYSYIFFSGWDANDASAKYFSLFNITVCAYAARYVSNDLLLLYSYVILIAHSALNSLFEIPVVDDKSVGQKSGKQSHFTYFNNSRSMAKLVTRYYYCINRISKSNLFISLLVVAGKLFVVPVMSMTWYMSFDAQTSLAGQIKKWSLIVICFSYTLRVYILGAYLSIIETKSKILYSNLNSIVARGHVARAEDRRTVLLLIESISGYYNRMAYRDSYDGIVEQMDVLKSVFATVEFLLLLLGFTFKNNL